MGDMVKDHQKNVAEFQRESNSGADPEVKALAAGTLPTSQQHLQVAQELQGQVN
jgi:putative membrane protein